MLRKTPRFPRPFWLRKSLLALFSALAGMPDSRAEQVVFSEVMYHPAGTQPEFLEVWNLTTTPLDIAKWRFASGISFEFPDFVAPAPQAHLLKARQQR